jgi:hypothetical protein
MAVDLPMLFIHVFGDPYKLFSDQGVTDENILVARKQFNEGLELGENFSIFDGAKELLYEDGALSGEKIKEEFGGIDLRGDDALDWYKGEKNSHSYGVYHAFSQRAKVVEMLCKSAKFNHHPKQSSVLNNTHIYVNASGMTLASKVAHDAKKTVNYKAKHQHNATDQTGGTTEVIAYNGKSIVGTLQMQMGVEEGGAGGLAAGDVDVDLEVFSTNFTSELVALGQDAARGTPGRRNLGYLATRLRIASEAKRVELKKEKQGMKNAHQADEEEDGGLASSSSALTPRERAIISFFVPKYDNSPLLNIGQFKSSETFYQLKLKQVVGLMKENESSSDGEDGEDDEDDEDAEDDEDDEEEYTPPGIMTKTAMFDGAVGGKRHSDVSHALRTETESWAKKLKP